MGFADVSCLGSPLGTSLGSLISVLLLSAYITKRSVDPVCVQLVGSRRVALLWSNVPASLISLPAGLIYVLRQYTHLSGCAKWDVCKI